MYSKTYQQAEVLKVWAGFLFIGRLQVLFYFPFFPLCFLWHQRTQKSYYPTQGRILLTLP